LTAKYGQASGTVLACCRCGPSRHGSRGSGHPHPRGRVGEAAGFNTAARHAPRWMPRQSARTR
jgi:hypothetical protein